MNAIMQSVNDLGKLKLAMMVGVTVVLLAFFAFLATRASNPAMSPMYSDISLEDSGAIVEELNKSGIPYELTAGGKQVLVPTDKVEQMRVRLATLGLPKTGSMVGYEIFDHSDALGTSNFVLNVNKMRALEGELARTISSLAQVESARVHLVIPKRELFTREKTDPTASVVLKVRGAAGLEKMEIAAIKHLVATAVPGLKPSHITIVDDKGNLLAKGVEDENDPEVLASTANEFRVGMEHKLERTIESLLEKSVGTGKVQAKVNADIDFDRTVTNSETFDPDGQVARSVQTIEESEKETEKDNKDNVSVANNLPNAKAQNAGLANDRNSQRTDETTNYEISKTVKNHIKQTGSVKRLSVAVLVDGTYVPNAKGEKVYTPRSKAELDQLTTLVRSAVGYDAKRGDTVEVLNMAFVASEFAETESQYEWLKRDFNSIFQTVVLAAVAILVILLIIRPLVQKSISAQDADDIEERELQRLLGSSGIAGQLSDLTGEDDDDSTVNIDKIAGGVKSSLYRKINEMIESHPEESLNVLRGWAFERDE
jgi:flagellar M-ring protein FliF